MSSVLSEGHHAVRIEVTESGGSSGDIVSRILRDVLNQVEARYASDSEEDDSSLVSFLPYIIGGAALIVLMAVVLGVWLFTRSRSKSATLPTHVNGTSSADPTRQICLYPEAKPRMNYATLIQPDVQQFYHSPTCSECNTPVNTPPLRTKKRLLERRGSNASLTLDLVPHAHGTRPNGFSPPRESSTEEYLSSAGNRMSRKQLRSCLKNVKALHEEFWEIPMNHPDKVTVPGSGVKNRYRSIIPNEHTRVRLPSLDNDPVTSYINANYIKGYDGEINDFIATQGPMKHTVEDFWLLVWREQVPIIVMITKLREKNKSKCECYLPEIEDDCTYGGVRIQVKDVSEKEGYILRHLLLTSNDESLEVLHYWYTSWPDHKAPETARPLLDLVKEIEVKRLDPESGARRKPVVVHCSAGIGRTGCFIATSIGVQQLQEEHAVDILSTVCTMRLQRGGMVQTNEQYVFIHQALGLYEKELPAH